MPMALGAGVPARLLPKAAAEPSQFPEVRRLGHLELKAAEAERNKIAAVPGLMYRDRSGEFQDPDDEGDFVDNEADYNDDPYDI